MAELTAKTSNLPDSFSDPASIDARFDGLKDQLTASSDRLASLEVDIAAQNTAMEDVRTRLENGADKQAARALTATALKSRIDSGQPFSDTLKALEALVDDPASLAPLQPFAQSGVPTLAQLSEEFSSARASALEATEPPATEDGTISRLLAGAKSFVKVSSLNDTNGTGPASTLSKIAKALSAGQPTQAETLWQSLPEAARQASAKWHERFSARLEADRLLTDTVQKFLSQASSL